MGMEKSGESNAVVKVFFCILQCCLWCFEKCMKFISKTSYIITAMKGTSFCTSCFEGMGILFKNAGRLTALTMASGFVCTLGKISIIAASGLISYKWLDGMSDV